jgi:hypothetical protein
MNHNYLVHLQLTYYITIQLMLMASHETVHREGL